LTPPLERLFRRRDSERASDEHGVSGAPHQASFKALYYRRLLDPWVGDLVEVAWRGKFRLEAMDVYQGLAWWEAVVVDKEEASDSTDGADSGARAAGGGEHDGFRLAARYKIHYPGKAKKMAMHVTRPTNCSF